MYVINGSFLTRKMNGQIRVAIEIIKELDKLVLPNQVVIVAPCSLYNIEGLKNIEIIRYGRGNPKIWEQTYLFFYLLKSKFKVINFLNSHPLFRPDICYIHDVLFSAYPKLYKNLYGRIQKKYVKLMILTSVLWGKHIITVSNFSRDEICKYYKVDKNRIRVIYNGHQHMGEIEKDDGVFERIPQIKKNNYFLAVSGRTPQKNFGWIVKNAEANKNKIYIIAGKKEGATEENKECGKNLFYIEDVSDSEMKSLMCNCKAFIHPAIYEGFGMTPLEAIASGCNKIILANNSCLPEIYGNAAYYIDPFDSYVNIDEIIDKENKDTKSLLEKYSWENSAKELHSILFN